MARLADRYVGELFRKFGRFAPWLPDVPVQLGAVGVIENGEFRRKTTLASLGIAVTASPPGPATVLDHTSARGVTLTMKAEGQLLPDSPLAAAEAGASVSFSRVGGIVLQSSGVRARTILNAGEVARSILARFAQRAWEEDWVFVDEVRSARSTTILISEENDTRLDLRASGKVAPSVPLSGAFVVAAKRGSITSFVGAAGFTPLFNLSRVKKEWLVSLVGKTPAGTVVGAKRARPARGLRSSARRTNDAELLEPVSFDEGSRSDRGEAEDRRA